MSQEKEISFALLNFNNIPNDAHVRLPVVASLYSVSEPTVWRWVKSGRIPKPKKLGPSTTAWNVGELRASLAVLSGVEWEPKVMPKGRGASAVDKYEQLLRDLKDPRTVHAAMLRGTIAKPALRDMLHLYGAEAIEQFDRGQK